jgi:uncharacterized protein (TIGR00730 family)
VSESSGIVVQQLGEADRRWAERLLTERWGSTRVVIRGHVVDAAPLAGLVALQGDERVGLATYAFDGDACELVTLDAVKPLRGIGTALVDRLAQTAKEAGCTRIRLITTNDNLQALRFYQRRGFRLVRVHAGALGVSRRLKPEIPEVGIDGIPLRDEMELELVLAPEQKARETSASAGRLSRVCVYCGSSDDVRPEYLEGAAAMGQALARRGLTVIFGGGKTGLMGALADSALAAGGEVIGIIPEDFNTPALAHAHLSQLRVVASMHERKQRMAEIGDAFIALPGGFGTMEELFEILTWAQIGIHAKPVGILNTLGYFGPLLALIEHARAEGFIYDEHRSLLACEADPEALIARLESYLPPQGLERWLTRVEGV